jgi:Uma2 family endonuclease
MESTSELRRFTRREYDALVAQGFFEGEPIELLHGLLLTMSPQGDDHFSISVVVANVLTRALPERFGIATHSPFAASDDSEPEPDVYVFDRQAFARQIPDRALLVVEVSRSSLRRDRHLKLPIYARNGVPEYWIVNLVDREVEVHSEPDGDSYKKIELITMSGALHPKFDPTIEIAMSSLPWADPIS